MRVVVPILVAVAVAATGGCNATKRELTVVFVAGTPNDQRVAALHACDAVVAHATPEPVVSPTARANRARGNVLITFRIDAANDRDIARLEACLQKQPGVQGFQDSAS